jgi:hypothetical protein
MRLLLPLLFLTGCTAGRSTFMMVNAQREYQAAVSEGAEERALYEITLAREYLQKAKEEDGYSSYGAVDQLCRTSLSWSQAAYKKSTDGIQIPDAGEVVPEERLPTPAQPTTPPTNEPVIDLDEP